MGKNDTKELHSILEQLKKSYADTEEADNETKEIETQEDDDNFQKLLTNFFSSDTSIEEQAEPSDTYNFTVSDEEGLTLNDETDESDITQEAEEAEEVEDIEEAEDEIDETVEVNEVSEEEDDISENDEVVEDTDIEDIDDNDEVVLDMSEIYNDATEDIEDIKTEETSIVKEPSKEEKVITEHILSEPIDNTKRDEVTAVENVFRIMFSSRDKEHSNTENVENAGNTLDISSENAYEEELIEDDTSYEDEALDIQDVYAPDPVSEEYEEEIEYSDDKVSENEEDIITEDISSEDEIDIESLDADYYFPCDTENTVAMEEDEDEEEKPYQYDPLQGHLSDAAYVVRRHADGEIDFETKTYDKKAELDDEDISLLLDFGYDEEIQSEAGLDRTNEIKKQRQSMNAPNKHSRIFGYSGKEYLDRSQNKEIKQKYIKDKRILIIKSALTLLAALVLIFASFVYWHDETSDHLIYPTIELIAVLFASTVAITGIIDGAKGISKLDPSHYSITAFLVFMQIIYDVFVIIMQKNSNVVSDDRMVTGGAMTILYIAVSLLADILQCEAEMKTFSVVSKDEVLYSAEKFNKAKTEKDEKNGRRNLAMSDNMLGNNVYKVQKTDMANGYFQRMGNKTGKCLRVMYFMGIVPIIALVMGCITLIINKNAYVAISSVMAVIYMGFPMSFLLFAAVPYYFTSKCMAEKDCAIVSESSYGEYAEMDTLMFDDRDAVKIVESIEIRPEDHADVSEALELASRAFYALGGPLSKLIKVDPEEKKADINIISVKDSGVEFYMDSHIHVIIGDKNFLSIHGMKVTSDNIVTASSLEGKQSSVIYVAFNGVPQLGYIISANVKKEFSNTVKELSKVGIKTAVSTYSPIINDYYFEVNKPLGVASAVVYKPTVYEDKDDECFVDGGIYALSDPCKMSFAVTESGKLLKTEAQNKSFSTLVAVLGTAVGILCVLLLAIFSSGMRMGIFVSIITLLINAASVLGVFMKYIDKSKFKSKKNQK